MTTVPPSSPPPQRLDLVPQALVVAVTDPPAALVKLAPGSRLEGLVVDQGARGSAQVRTDFGTLDLRTAVPLAKGALLALLLKEVSPKIQIQITAVSRPHAPPRVPLPADVAVGFGQAAPNPQPLVPGTVHRLARLATGARLIATLSQPMPWISGLAEQPASSVGPARPADDTVSTLPAGSRLTLRVVGMQPATASTHAAQASSFEPRVLASGRTLRATVAGASPSGQSILRVGDFTLAAAPALPRGMGLLLEIVGASTMPPTVPAGHPPYQSVIAVRKEGVLGPYWWSVLTEAVGALLNADPVAGQRLIETVVPRLDSRLATSVLFFVSALRAGDIRGWLGDTVARGLDRVRPDLVTRLGDEFQRLLRAADDPVSKDWRISQVPLFTGIEIEPIRLWIRHHSDPPDEGDAQQNQDQRFVVDVSLSRLGRLQLDGLVRDSGRRLDLIVRSETSLLPTMRDHIRTLFAQAKAMTGLIGGVEFQAAPPDFVNVKEGVPADQDTNVVV